MAALPKIAVLLPTYNGSRFLGSQLDSLLAQHGVELLIVTRDDGSGDDTVAIVQAYAERFPEQFHVVPANGQNLGAAGSFSLLMHYVLEQRAALGLDPLHVALCDQDDVWDSGKLEIQLAALQTLEARYPGQPVLVHSDLTVVAEDLAPIADSLLAFHGLAGERNDLRNLIFSNTVTGCTALFNEALLRRALPIPAAAMMHDWWLALVAAAFGHIHFLPQRLVLYRQHGQNTLGAREYRPPRLLSRRTWRRLLAKNPDQMLYAVASQAAAFADRHGHELRPGQRLCLSLASGLRSDSLLRQRLLFRLLRF